MPWLKTFIFVVALIQGSWLIFDGGRALIVGDYVTQRSGPRAGELGVWARVVAAIGLAPRGRVVKWVHVILGVAWLAGMIMFMLRPGVGWWVMLGCAIGTLWYVPIGTVLSLAQIGLLLAISRR